MNFASGLSAHTEFMILDYNPNVFISTNGGTGQLLFTLPPYVGKATIDNAIFKARQFPNWAFWGLFALGSLLLAWRRRKHYFFT
jgi:hypothetical protein